MAKRIHGNQFYRPDEAMIRQRRMEMFIHRFIGESAPPLAMYDIGVGHKSEWQTLGSAWPKMRIFGCEPHPVQHATIIGAGFPGPLAEVAIGYPEGKTKLLELDAETRNATITNHPGKGKTFDVDVWTLDNFDTWAGKQDRILMWMDIEGAELIALQSGMKLLASGRVRWINLEERKPDRIPTADWAKPEELQKFLTTMGFKLAAGYNPHLTHWDAIYIHKHEHYRAKVEGT